MGTLIVKQRPPLTLIIKTDNLSTGSSANNQFVIPHQATGSYDYKVNWGDGVEEAVTGNTSPTHTYESIGTYTVRIMGSFAGFYFNNTGDRLKLLQVADADKNRPYTTGVGSFFGCANLTKLALLNISNMTDTTNFCRECTSLTAVPQLDFSSVTLSPFAFLTCSNLSNIDILNTQNISFTARGMFRNITSIVSFPLIGVTNWTTFWEVWRNEASLQTFPANFFDGWVGTPATNCFLDTWDLCNALTTTSVENILVSIDTSGRSAPIGATGTQADITIDYDVATGGLTGATNTAITNLKAKGWKPHINNVYV